MEIYIVRVRVHPLSVLIKVIFISPAVGTFNETESEIWAGLGGAGSLFLVLF